MILALPKKPGLDRIRSLAQDAPDSTEETIKTRKLTSLLAAGSLGWATFMAWNSIITIPSIGLLAAVAFLLIAIAAIVILGASKRWLWVAELVIMILSCAVLIGWAVASIYTNPQYGTDEAAFIQGASQLALQGHNPYTANLLPFLQLFRVPVQYATYLLNGGVSHSLAYPAGSFLVVEPFVWLTGGTQAAIVASLTSLITSIIIAFFLLPQKWRMLGVAAVAPASILFAFSLSGLSVMMSLPFLLIVAIRWADTIQSQVMSRWSYLQAVCLGIACAISQLSWFIAIFLLVGLFRAASIRGDARASITRIGKFFGIALATFVVLNAPWIKADPYAWLHGIFLPLIQQAIPYGQGFIDLPVYFHLGGGTISGFSILGDVVLLFCIVGYYIWFDRIPSAIWILPGVALWFPTRSLAEYFTVLAPLWVASVATESSSWKVSSVISSKNIRKRSLITVCAALPVLVLGGYVISRPPPIAVKLLHTESNGEFGGIWKLWLSVQNKSSTTLVHPRFSTDSSGHVSSYWFEVSGPNRLLPRQRSTFVIEAPNVGSMPGITQPFAIQIVSASPGTISESATITPEPYVTYISPNGINNVLRPNQGIWLQVQLRSPYGALVHKAGVRVALGQVIYGQSTLQLSDARINGAAFGQTPVFARTNRNGEAMFHVVAPKQSTPIYFQSWVSQKGSYPFGYSETLSVLWR